MTTPAFARQSATVIPMVSDGYATARDAIVARVEALLNAYAHEARSTSRNSETS